jgi:hypothetical protein
VRLQLVATETGEIIASRETRSTRWTDLTINVVAKSEQMPYSLHYVAGVGPAENIGYRVLDGAECVAVKRTVASTGEFRLPHAPSGPWWHSDDVSRY